MANLAPPTPYQWQVGDIGSASLLNAQLYNGLTYLLGQPVFFGVQGTAGSCGSSDTVVAIDTGVVDTYGGHSNSTNNSRYVAQEPGYYLVCGCVAFAGNATGMRQAKIKKNGSNVQGGANQVPGSSSGLTTISTQIVPVYLNGTGDYVEVWAWQNAGSSLSLASAPDQASSLSVFWIHN